MSDKMKNPGTGASVHGVKENKRWGSLLSDNTFQSSPCQSAAAQRRIILDWLQTIGSLTTFDSREKLLIPHPAGRINELRQQGFAITTERCWEYSAGGSRHLVARYSLEAQEGEK